jgi:hypothetical protein
MRSYNVWNDTEGVFEKDGREIHWKIRWVKDLCSDTVQIDEIIEAYAIKDCEEDAIYFDEHEEKLNELIIEAAYKKGEPIFDESATWSDMQECFAELEG